MKIFPSSNCSQSSMQVLENNEYSFQIQCSVYLDLFYGCVFREGWNPEEKFYYSRGTSDGKLVLKIPQQGDYCYQIFGQRAGRVVAGLYGKTDQLIGRTTLHLIPQELNEEGFGGGSKASFPQN